MTQSCMRSAHDISCKTPRRVRFADPIAVAFQESVIPGPRKSGCPDSFAKQVRRGSDARDARPARRPQLGTSVPYLPFARHPTLDTLARQQNMAMGQLVGAAPRALGKGKIDLGPGEELAVDLRLDLVGVIDAVEDSTVMRYGSYAVLTGGAMVLVPVATVFLFGCASLYAGYWGVRQLTSLGASSARKVLGMPDATLPWPSDDDDGGHIAPSVERGVESWPTEPYIIGQEDF